MVAEPVRRRVDLAALVEHLTARAADGASQALARRRRNGHSADCPHWGRPVDSCSVCRAEVIGRTTDGGEDP